MICLLLRRMSKPCFPSKISFMNEIIPTQMLGLTSTPPTGGTSARVGFRSGSVGRYANTHGGLETGTEGYQVMTMRMMNMTVATLKNGPSTPATWRAVSGSSGSLAASSNARSVAALANAAEGSDSAARENCE